MSTTNHTDEIERELRGGPLVGCGNPRCGHSASCPRGHIHTVARFIANREAKLRADHRCIEREQFEHWSAKYDALRAEVELLRGVETYLRGELGDIDDGLNTKLAALDQWRQDNK